MEGAQGRRALRKALIHGEWVEFAWAKAGYLLAPWNFSDAFSSGVWTARTAPGLIGDER